MECFIMFSVCCSHGHELSKSIGDDSITYRHDNPTDCVDGEESVTIAKVTPEQLAVVFQPKHATKKAASKKTTKK